MPIDGTFLHHLISELNSELKGFKINKIYQPSFNEIIIQSRGKGIDGSFTSKDLYLSCNLDKPKIYITKKKYLNPETPLNFTMLLRKYIDRGVIIEFKQLRNDRIPEIVIEAANEQKVVKAPKRWSRIWTMKPCSFSHHCLLWLVA